MASVSSRLLEPYELDKCMYGTMYFCKYVSGRRRDGVGLKATVGFSETLYGGVSKVCI